MIPFVSMTNNYGSKFPQYAHQIYKVCKQYVYPFFSSEYLQMANKFDEVLLKFDNSTRLLDKISEECQKYANLLHVNSKQDKDRSNCCMEIISDIEQIRMLLKKLNCNKEQLTEIKPKENDMLNKRPKAANKRNTRSSSMKYLVQWEKMVEAQLAQNASQNSGDDEKPQLLPKPVIKRRLRQFENKDTKRVSSTAEYFLDEAEETDESYEETIDEEKEEELCETGTDYFKPKIVDVVVSICRKFSKSRR